MKQEIIKPTGFRQFAFKKFIWVSVFSIVSSLIATLLISGLYLGTVYQQETHQISSDLDKALTQLKKANGNPSQIETILAQINSKNRQNTYHFSDAKAWHEGLQPDDKTSAQFANLARLVKTDKAHVQTFDFKNLAFLGGIPLYKSVNCQDCTVSDAQREFIGTLFYKHRITLSVFGSGIFGIFLLIFILNFFVIGVYMMTRTLEQDFIEPLKNLSQRVDKVRLYDNDIIWQRQTQKIAEIDMIDEMITEHIQMLKTVYEKLDALMVTEHDSGFFHQNRFKETLQFEIYRSERYKRPLSMVVIKLIKITSSTSNTEVTLAEKIHVFADLINQSTRNVDIPFRVREQLFVILMPEIDENDIRIVARKYYKRFSKPSHTVTDEPISFNFKIEIGYASYGYDAITAKEMMQVALDRLTAEPLTEEEILNSH